MDLDDFMIQCARRYNPNQSQRVGQFYMNTLAEIRPDLYRKVTGSNADPFFSNNRLSNFWNWLAENWESSINPTKRGCIVNGKYPIRV